MQQYQTGSIQIDGTQYKLNGLIGKGGAGIVYNAQNNHGQRFAMKVIKNYNKNPILKQSVDSQIKIQKMFKGQKYIINYIAQKVIKNDMYIVIQLGQLSLRNRIDMKNLVQDQYLQMLIDVANGLRLIHSKKIIHRDIKPQNIIYSKGLFKITDFGTSSMNQTSNQVAGTLIYWAPQLLFDQTQQFTQSVDIWSFGIMAFEAYFLIHPFLYNKQTLQSIKQARKQIQKNIQSLMPNFSFGKLITRLNSLGYYDKAQFIQNKLQQTHQSLIDLFKSIFIRKPRKRLDTQFLLATLQSIQQDQISRVQIKNSRLIDNRKIPSDVNLFIKALNLFYKLNHDYYFKNQQQVQKHFQLAIRLFALNKNQGKDYIHYHNKQFISKVQKPSQQQLQKIKQVLSQYYFYLKQTKEIQCHDQISELRTLVCLCSCWDNIILKDYRKLLKKIILITNLQMQTLQQFQKYISQKVFTQRQLASIQNFILSQYLV